MKDRDHDQSMDHLLRRALSPEPDGAATRQCADAETLAAWADGSLSGEALARAEHHAAACARCQAMLAAMARTVPEITIPPRWQVLAARWVVPIAAAAIVLAVWVSVDRQRPGSVAVKREPAAAEAEFRPVPKSMGAPPSSPSLEANAPVARRRGGAIGGSQVPRSRNSAADSRLVAPEPDRKVADARDAERREARLSPLRPPLAAPGPTPAPASPKPAAANETVQVTSAMPTAVSQSQSVAAKEALRSAAIDIISPEPAFRWRLLPPGTILRSTNGGITWTTQAVRFAGQKLAGDSGNLKVAELAPPITLTSGSAAAREVCWIAGAGGVVLLSTDGTTWQRRPFPEPLNLTAVRAVDAKTAIVTTEDGRQFSTADGGATWSKIP